MSTDKVNELLLRWEELREEGRAITPEELCQEQPQLLEQLKSRIAALSRMDWLNRLQAEDTLILAPGRQVDGYRLVARMGRGGFAEVWEATDSQGERVALKFIGLTNHAATGELKATKLLETIRHPYLISVRHVWQTDDFLVVAMELADRTLLDRWHEAGRQIPAEEVLRYFQQAAEAIDFLHEQNIHHRDIKPQNLLLVGNVLKVADFGLVRLLSSTVTGHTGSLTVAYSAPEFFDGRTTKSSDQYCLAVTYVQMRGGRLPFEGTLTQMMAGHLTKSPDLSALPEAERPIVARALAKSPDERWPSCKAFVEALSTAEVRRGGRRHFLLAGLLCIPLLIAASLLLQPGKTAKSDAPSSSAFIFDGKGRIVTPLERFAPAALEAWVYPEPIAGGRPERTFIGADIPGKSGIGIGCIFHDRTAAPLVGCQILPSPTYRDVPTNQPLPLRKWSHIAAAFGERQTLVFFNGKMVAKGAPCGNLGGTPFVVGNAGKDNPDHYFVGRIRTVRISRGERYSEDFVPEASFAADGAAMLIYDAAKVQGTKVLDLSGRENHGVAENVTTR